MKTRIASALRTLALSALFLLILQASLSTLLAQGTAFTYQGRLNDGANPANGAYDLTFTLFDAVSGGATLGTSNVFNDLLISNGLFTVTLDHGAQFDGNARWLQIAVRPGASEEAYTDVTPRQALLPAPYAIYAASAGAGGGGIWSLNGANAYYNSGSVGVGTASPVTRFTVAGAGAYNSPTAAAITLDNTTAARRWEWHALDDGKLQLADFTVAATRLVIDTAGNVGVGTPSPASTLDVRGNLVLEAGGSPGLFTAASGGEQNRYLSLVNSPSFQSASGLKAGGLLVSDDYFFANPGKSDLIVKGNVGIGTATPDKKLTIYEPGFGIEHTDGTVRLASYVNSEGGWLGTISDHKLHFFVNNGQPSMTVDSVGDVGIGTSSPVTKLDVAGRARINGLLDVVGDTRINGQLNLNNVGASTVTMSLYALPGAAGAIPFDVIDSAGNELFRLSTGSPGFLSMFGNASKSSGGTSWGVLSDRRLKQDVRSYEPGLNEVLQLRPVRFHYRDDAKLGLTSAQEEVGFVAQEVREVIPDAVIEGKDDYLMLRADPIHWAAINAIRELNTKLEDQRAENAELKQRLEKLEQLLNRGPMGGAR
jgi:hypothetical protein